jgi:hypothetical protein
VALRAARQARPRFLQVLLRSTWPLLLSPTHSLHTHFLYNFNCCPNLSTLYRLDVLQLPTFIPSLHSFTEIQHLPPSLLTLQSLRDIRNEHSP